MRYALLVLALTLPGYAQDSTDKQELRNKFEKGQTLKLDIKNKMSLKLEQIPAEFQEMLGDEPFNMDFAGQVELEVKEVAEDGTATLEGKFKKMDVKGNAFVNEIDFHWKEGDTVPEPEEGGGAFGMDPAAMLAQLATQTLSLKVSNLGKIEFQGDQGQAGGMLNQLLSLNGMMGALPKDKVGAGDTWKSKDQLSIPGAGSFVINLHAENKIDKFEGDDAVVKTKLTVGTAQDESATPDEGNMFNLKAKMTGGGEGQTKFSVKAGRVSHAQNSVNVKITATMDNPQGGDALEFKAALKIEQEHKIE